MEMYSKQTIIVKYSLGKNWNLTSLRGGNMNVKKIGILMISMFLLTLAGCSVVGSAPEETRAVYHLEYGGLIIDIKAPYQADPGENITVTVRTEAVSQIYVKYIYVNIYGIENATDEVSLKNITHLEDSPLGFHEVEYEVTIPDNISPGLTYGVILCEWDVMGAPEKIPPAGFILTYVKHKEFEQLQAAYDELNATYHSSLANYTELESKHKDEVSSARNLMYLFVGTTIVSAATVIVILIRRPKRLWT